MRGRSAAAACTTGSASTSRGKRSSSEICRIGWRCSASDADVSRVRRGPERSAGGTDVSRGTVADHIQSGDPHMSRLGFGAFLAPHHPVGEHPMLQFRRDLDFVEHLDKLGYDEFWCGEHHSSGWEMIASPEMFLAAAGERSKRIKLATGVVSLPYHQPSNVPTRLVQLDYMTGGRVIFGSGPGALASDAHSLR